MTHSIVYDQLMIENLILDSTPTLRSRFELGCLKDSEALRRFSAVFVPVWTREWAGWSQHSLLKLFLQLVHWRFLLVVLQLWTFCDSAGYLASEMPLVPKHHSTHLCGSRKVRVKRDYWWIAPLLPVPGMVAVESGKVWKADGRWTCIAWSLFCLAVG